MSLKNCEDCGKAYSSKAEKCIHCGAPNQSDDDWLGELLGGLFVAGIIGWFIYANGANIKNFVNEIFNAFNVGVISEQSLTDCDNDRIKTSMKQAFDESPYAQTLHLKAVMIQAQRKSNDAYLLSCKTILTLNNSETVSYTFNFSKQDNQYLIEGIPNF